MSRTLFRLLCSVSFLVAFLGIYFLPFEDAAAILRSNGLIAFVEMSPTGNYQIYSMKADGSVQTRLTNNSANDFNPSQAPDGTKIAFDSNRNGNEQIYSMNADGSGQTRLSNNTANDDYPSWSSGSAKIVFHSGRDGNGEIYSMNADGSGQTRLTNNSAKDDSPRWSPDGMKITFVSNRDGNDEIYSMNADGSGQTRLTNNSSADYSPHWSPDGAKIIFYSDQSGNFQIYSINADGSGQTRLTHNTANDFAPSCSPDGTKFVFFSDRDSRGMSYQIYSMNADGSGQTRLTTSNTSYYPDWGPMKQGAEFYFSWYDNQMGHLTWIMGANPAGQPDDVLDIYLKNLPLQLGVNIPGGGTSPKQFVGRMDGPVQVVSQSTTALVSERSLFGSSFEEIWATPYSELDSHYYWPNYNGSSQGRSWLPSGSSLSEWVLVANPADNGEAVQADLSFWINTTPYTYSQTIQPGECWTPIYPGLTAHDVEVKAYRVGGSSSIPGDARKVIASERLLMNGAFNEMPGIPATGLSNHFMWTWYDSVSGSDVVSVGNPNLQSIYVTFSIAGQPAAPYLLDPNHIVNFSTGTTKYMNGPVEVVGCNDTSQPCTNPANVYASQTSVIGSAYEEIAGTPVSTLTSNANWTWYDEQSPGSLNWVLVSNPNAFPIYYEISIPGIDPATTPGAGGVLQPGKNKTPRFPGMEGGPVQVKAWTDSGKGTTANVMASQRVLWSGFFNEVVGKGM